MRRSILVRIGVLVASLGVLTAACTTGDGNGEQAGGQQEARSTLDVVKERGRLICGVNDLLPGFGLLNEEGEFEGFDVDFCRAVAAGVLGDAEAVDFVPLTAETRFTALQAGEIDVLIRNTTWTSSRDGSEGAEFLSTTFYDGQGMMVNADSPYQSLADMGGTVICVVSGTTTELNLASVFSSLGLDFEQLSFEDNETLQQAFEQERCDGWTGDKSALAGLKAAWPDSRGGPDALRILEETMSKEPLGPVVRDGDSEWAQAVDWIVLATIQAEEYDIDSTNVLELVDSINPDRDPERARFLGLPGEEGVFDPGLGLATDFVVQVVSQVGNYGEIYERHVGPDTPVGLERLFNSLWTDGGLLYAPPYR